MDSTSDTIIKSMTPKREWLVRCDDDNGAPGVCSISVCNGRLEIYDCQESLMTLTNSQIADFRSAFDEAIAQAEIDLQVNRAQARSRAAVPRVDADVDG